MAKGSSIQALYELCKKTFTPSAAAASPKAIRKLSALMDTITPAEVGLDHYNLEDDVGHSFFGSNERKTSNRSGRWAQPITYLHIYECHSFTIGIFCLPTSSVIPLHDHPGMMILSKILYVSMHVKAYRKVPSLRGSPSSQNGDILSGSSNLRFHNTAVDQGASTDSFSGVMESEDLRRNMLAIKAPSLHGQSSSQCGDMFNTSSILSVQDTALDQGISTSNFSGVKRTEDLRTNMHARKVPSRPGLNSSQSGDVSFRLSDLRVRDTEVDQGTSISNLSNVINVEDTRTNMHARKAPPLSAQSSLQTIDLNSSPRRTLGENHGVSTHAPSAVASTISGRHERHQRIRILLSSSRPRQTNGTSEVSRRYVERDVITPEVEEGISASHIHDVPSRLNPVSLTESHWQNDRPVSQPTSNFAPCILSDQSNFRPVDGAKEHVLSIGC